MEFSHPCIFPMRFLPISLDTNLLSRQCAVNKDDFSRTSIFIWQMANPARIHIKRGDVQFIVRHRCSVEKQRKKHLSHLDLFDHQKHVEITYCGLKYNNVCCYQLENC